MEKTIPLKRQATIDMYIYTESFKTNKPISEPDAFSMTNMYIVPVLDFDVHDLAGKRIVSAKLEMTCLNAVETLAVDISTVSQQWDAVAVTYQSPDGVKPWATGGWMSDVVMSAGHSRYFRESVSHDEGSGAVTIGIPPEVVYAMATDQTFGFLVMDVKSRFYGHPEDAGQYAMRFAADSSLGSVPTLTVVYEDLPSAVPAPVEALSALSLAVPDGTNGSMVQLNWSTGEAYGPGMHYRIYIAEHPCSLEKMTPVDKYATPNLCGGVCGTTIAGLKADTEYFFAVEISDGVVRSEARFVATRTLTEEKLPVIVRSAPQPRPSSQAAYANALFTVGVTDDVAKIDPIDGSLYDFAEAEAAWNTGIFEGGRISLCCAKGEKTAFQIAVTINAQSADFSVAIEGGLDEWFRLHKLWCLKCGDRWYPDVAVPLEGDAFSIPFAENKIPGQRELTLLVDVSIPKTAQAGRYAVSLRLSSAGHEAVIPVDILVAPVSLESSNFKLELNGYIYLPRCAGYEADDPRCPEVERGYHRLAYEHDCTVNILPYTQIGTMQPGFAPKIGLVDGVMRVLDWSEWDAHFAPYLDGSYVVDIGGEKVPVTHMYLPFHENWPMPIEEYYRISVPDLPYPDNVTYQVRQSDDIYEDFRPGYREGIKSVMKDFIVHFEEKGWKNVDFQYFYNNKNFYKEKKVHETTFNSEGLGSWLGLHTIGNDGEGTSWWLLDEPHFRADWEVLAYYASILREAQAETGAGKQIKFRADLSCYFQAFDFLDGLLDVNVVGGTYARYREDVLRKRRHIFGEDYWPYGSWTGIDEDNANCVRWILDIYLKGGGGIVPWYNFGRDRNYEIPDALSALYPGRRFGMDTALASMRLKAGRKALELIRYFDAMKRALGYSDRQLKEYVSAFISLEGSNTHTDAMDAGTARYSGAQCSLEDLKRDMLRRLTVAGRTYA